MDIHKELGDRLLNSNCTLDEILANQKNESPYVRCAVAQALGTRDSRRAHEPLIELIKDEDYSVKTCAVLFLGVSKDSRALFCLANLWDSEQELRQRIILSLGELKDPRAPVFIDNVYTQISDKILKERIQKAKEASERNSEFTYTFHGKEERRKEAEEAEGQLVVREQASLETIKEILEQRETELQERPQTYVITQGSRFMTLGVNLDEHVDTAKGRDVYTAGEIQFKKEGNTWKVTYINNRSNGYYPGTNFQKVDICLRRAQIPHPDEFTETFPRDGYFTQEFLKNHPFFKEG